MFTKILASLVVVAALGVSGFTMYSNTGCTGCPFSSMTSESPCCAVQASCCDVGASCCTEGEAQVASVVPDCCFPGSPCCDGSDCCLKATAAK